MLCTFFSHNNMCSSLTSDFPSRSEGRIACLSSHCQPRCALCAVPGLKLAVLKTALIISVFTKALANKIRTRSVIISKRNLRERTLNLRLVLWSCVCPILSIAALFANVYSFILSLLWDLDSSINLLYASLSLSRSLEVLKSFAR